MPLQIKPVENRRELKEFLYYPYRKYAGHPFWIPPLLFDQRAILDRRRHPFYLEAEAEFFLARRNGETCGRIAAIRNHTFERHYHEPKGFFGFFETEPAAGTARALLDAAADWAAAKGLTTLQGPMDPSTNYVCGSLVDGFGSPPAFMMPYNSADHALYYEAAGFAKAKDLLTYFLSADLPFPEKIRRIARRVIEQEGLVIRTLDFKNLSLELDRIFEVYNNAWSANWGFVPYSRAELDRLAADLRWVLDPRIIFVAEKGDTPVGFLFAMPDLNRIFQRSGGRLLPAGWFHLLRNRRRLGYTRVLAMGFSREYQNLGFTAAMYEAIIDRGGEAGYRHAEIGWVLEDNIFMNRAAAMLGAAVNKRYRIYEKKLG